jgi:KTSC domain
VRVQLTPVVSSNVRAAAYFEEQQLFVVHFSNGDLYSGLLLPAEVAAFEAAESKGRYLATLRGRLTRIGTAYELQAVAPPPVQSAVAGATVAAEPPMQSYQEDECCGRHIYKFLRDDLTSQHMDRWNCPRCGQEWRAKIQGQLKRWYPHVTQMILR